MVEAEWDGQSLTVRGTTKPGRMALLGEDHALGEVTLQHGDIAGVELKSPKVMGVVNGNLVVRTVQGKRYQLHFRKKDAAQFTALAEALQS